MTDSLVVVVDFGLEAVPPREVGGVRKLVDAARSLDAATGAVDVGADAAGRAIVLAGGEEAFRLERLAHEARRAGVGVAVRLLDTRALSTLRDDLAVAEGALPEPLRDRVLVIVPSERIGKRLRHAARELPSAFELSARPTGLRSFLPRRSPNMLRAASDADDLVVPWGLLPRERLASAVLQTLQKRGARLWISAVPPAEVADARAVGAHGLLVRHAWCPGPTG